MTRNTFIRALNSVETPFCHSFSQICYTTVFAATNSPELSDLLSARGLAHSHRITNLFLVYFSLWGLAHCGCQLPLNLSRRANINTSCAARTFRFCPFHNSSGVWYAGFAAHASLNAAAPLLTSAIIRCVTDFLARSGILRISALN